MVVSLACVLILVFYSYVCMFFFFQAEDGIRDTSVTGVQTCALPISRIHLVQQGGELAYLLLHDPEYRRVRKEHLIETGRRIRLKQNIRMLPRLLDELEGYHFSLNVISAAPEEVDRKSVV